MGKAIALGFEAHCFGIFQFAQMLPANHADRAGKVLELQPWRWIAQMLPANHADREMPNVCGALYSLSTGGFPTAISANAAIPRP